MIKIFASNVIERHIVYPFLLESVGNKIAQAQTPKLYKRHMNNAWIEIISCSPCFAFCCFFSSLVHKQYGTTLIPLKTNMVPLLQPYSFSCLFHCIELLYNKTSFHYNQRTNSSPFKLQVDTKGPTHPLVADFISLVRDLWMKSFRFGLESLHKQD